MRDVYTIFTYLKDDEELEVLVEEEKRDEVLAPRIRSYSRTDKLKQDRGRSTPSPVPALELLRSDSVRMERALEYRNKIINRLHQDNVYSSDDEQVQIVLAEIKNDDSSDSEKEEPPQLSFSESEKEGKVEIVRRRQFRS